MQINGLNNPYTKAYMKNSNVSSNSSYNDVQKSLKENKSSETVALKSETSETNSLLTQKERNFFKQMFPDNQDQIQNHVLFNRSGRTQSYNLAKGTLIDGRI